MHYYAVVSVLRKLLFSFSWFKMNTDLLQTLLNLYKQGKTIWDHFLIALKGILKAPINLLFNSCLGK